mmetsp:Transcript_21184/g.53672  ORF Transcript_21184/g.53672 Transcript_21184/m.53672 type:complete len:83 (-) Transcript_21184:388-636(-)
MPPGLDATIKPIIDEDLADMLSESTQIPPKKRKAPRPPVRRRLPLTPHATNLSPQAPASEIRRQDKGKSTIRSTASGLFSPC